MQHRLQKCKSFGPTCLTIATQTSLMTTYVVLRAIPKVLAVMFKDPLSLSHLVAKASCLFDIRKAAKEALTQDGKNPHNIPINAFLLDVSIM